ncbi:MAG TPA: division/cell wall cluster transcriptional repressor MraZ [Candidatus Nanopelagicales bacterium]|nr:division/cell wall cluster transcriptional repressor MraZ [Candidatus Nanopelagicales bacterium]
MFLGTHAPRLDEKGRLILPAKFREDLAGGLVITKGQDHTLVLWPRPAFVAHAETLRAGSQTNERVRAYTRVLFASAHDDIPDKQGRITIPASLREYAAIERDCIVAGQDTRVEIWNPTTWADYQAAQEQNFAELDGEVVPMA